MECEQGNLKYMECNLTKYTKIFQSEECDQ